MRVVVSISIAGFVSASNHASLMEQMKVDLEVEEQVHGALQKMADEMGFSVDTNGDAYVSHKQFNDTIMPIGYDVDGDGKLTFDEMDNSKFSSPGKEIFKRADKNNDGHLSGHDWLKLADEYDPSHKGNPGLDSMTYHDMTQLAHHTVITSQRNFQHMDQNSDGRLHMEELKNVKEPNYDEWASHYHNEADYLAWNLMQREGSGGVLQQKDVHSLLEMAAKGGSVDDIAEGLRLLNPDKLDLLNDWMDNIHEKAIDHMEWHNTHLEHGFEFDL